MVMQNDFYLAEGVRSRIVNGVRRRQLIYMLVTNNIPILKQKLGEQQAVKWMRHFLNVRQFLQEYGRCSDMYLLCFVRGDIIFYRELRKCLRPLNFELNKEIYQIFGERFYDEFYGVKVFDDHRQS